MTKVKIKILLLTNKFFNYNLVIIKNCLNAKYINLYPYSSILFK